MQNQSGQKVKSKLEMSLTYLIKKKKKTRVEQA